ncbi:hypothetical protein J6590_083371 [Homalodisca vitripennis]|nr:hypothetical protein J6590_083371 [Homalodisca vitripennis]
MSRRSILISHMGSSLRSEPELEDRGSASTHSYDLLTPLSPRDRSFDTVSEASGEHSVVSHPFSEEAPSGWIASRATAMPETGQLFNRQYLTHDWNLDLSRR